MRYNGCYRHCFDWPVKLGVDGELHVACSGYGAVPGNVHVHIHRMILPIIATFLVSETLFALSVY